jgi:hypothetical protein
MQGDYWIDFYWQVSSIIRHIYRLPPESSFPGKVIGSKQRSD